MKEQKKELLKLLKLFDDNGYSEHLILICRGENANEKPFRN